MSLQSTVLAIKKVVQLVQIGRGGGTKSKRTALFPQGNVTKLWPSLDKIQKKARTKYKKKDKMQNSKDKIKNKINKKKTKYIKNKDKNTKKTREKRQKGKT